MKGIWVFLVKALCSTFTAHITVTFTVYILGFRIFCAGVDFMLLISMRVKI